MEQDALDDDLIGGVPNLPGRSGAVEQHSRHDGTSLGQYPVSPWGQVPIALDHATAACGAMTAAGAGRTAKILIDLAGRIESRVDELVDLAHARTALPAQTRLNGRWTGEAVTWDA